MIPAPLDTVLAKDPDQLLIEARGEDRTIEYKLALPEASVLRPLFDYVWNAAGYRGSLNYDENGNWRVNP